MSGEFRGFYMEGEYGTDSQASYMPYDTAERIIRECVNHLLSELDRE